MQGLGFRVHGYWSPSRDPLQAMSDVNQTRKTESCASGRKALAVRGQETASPASARNVFCVHWTAKAAE